MPTKTSNPKTATPAPMPVLATALLSATICADLGRMPERTSKEAAKDARKLKSSPENASEVTRRVAQALLARILPIVDEVIAAEVAAMLKGAAS